MCALLGFYLLTVVAKAEVTGLCGGGGRGTPTRGKGMYALGAVVTMSFVAGGRNGGGGLYTGGKKRSNQRKKRLDSEEVKKRSTGAPDRSQFLKKGESGR